MICSFISNLPYIFSVFLSAIQCQRDGTEQQRDHFTTVWLHEIDKVLLSSSSEWNRAGVFWILRSFASKCFAIGSAYRDCERKCVYIVGMRQIDNVWKAKSDMAKFTAFVI